MNYSVIILIIITALSCGTSKTDDNNFKVEHKGALKNFMHKGDISAKADLLDFEEINHFYALGAIENLKGEIQIFDSESSNTTIIEDSLIFDHSFNKKASLLVYASVDNWNIIGIPESVSTYNQLEKFIEFTAKENRINIDKPFPFLVEGPAKSFDWHVINWKSDDKEHTHEKHKTSGLYGTEKNRQVELLGFYSNAHHAIFTHHTTNMHIHVKTVDKKIAGHLDNLTLGKGMMLKLPEVNKHH